MPHHHEVRVHPACGPQAGGTEVEVELLGDASWTDETRVVVVFCTHLRRVPVRAELLGGGRAACRCVSPRWGAQDTVAVQVLVEKVPAGAGRFFFHATLAVTRAQPAFARASGLSELTLAGDNLPPEGLPPDLAAGTLRVRVVAEDGAVLREVPARIEGGGAAIAVAVRDIEVHTPTPFPPPSAHPPPSRTAALSADSPRQCAAGAGRGALPGIAQRRGL